MIESGTLPDLEALRQEEPQSEDGEPGEQRAAGEDPDLGHADVAPDETVDPGHHDDAELDQEHHGRLHQGPLELIVRDREIEAQQVGERERREQHGDVEQVLDLAAQVTLPEGSLANGVCRLFHH